MTIQGRPARRQRGASGKSTETDGAAIQPHGLLFALEAKTLAITQVSANIGDVLGCPPAEAIGTGIADFVDAEYGAALAVFAASKGRTTGPAGRVVLRGATGELPGWRAASHRTGDTIIVEVSSIPAESPDLDGFLFDATRALRAVRDHAGIDATAATVARRLREMTGYERVLVLRFDRQGHGEVIAENRSPSAGPSLLGVHLRAAEVPAAARAIALRNPIRMIRDLAAAPVPMISAAGSGPAKPLDLSEAILRAPPPSQVQLLARFGARSALLMSLVRDRRLWGLIVFLHRTPRRLPMPYRSTLRLMADAIAVRFAAAENQEHARELARRHRALAALEQIFDREAGDSAAAILRRHGRSLLRIVGASGAWCHLPETDFTLGDAPPLETARRIAALCRLRSAGGIYATDHVAGLNPALAAAADVAGGAFFTALPRSHGALLFLRGQTRMPRGPDSDRVRCLKGRAAAWREAREHHSEVWTDADHAIAPEAAALVDAVAPGLAERRNMRRVLENEAKLRAILDATLDGLVVVDRGGTVLDFSSGAEHLFGWSAAEIVGKPVERLIPESLRDRHREGLARATHELHPRMLGGDGRLHALRKDGTTFPFELTLTSRVLGGETFFIGALRDITERLSAEQRDRFWFEHSSVGYSVSDLAGDRRLRVNPALCRFLGYSESELLSMNVFAAHHPDDVSAALEWRNRAQVGGDEPYRRLQRFVRKDGKIVWGRVTASPIRVPGSDSVQIVSEIVDITDLMESDAKLRAALAHAEAASAAKSQFLATMSHELRTPLNAIIGLSEMMVGEIMGPIGNAHYADYVRDIHRAGRHLLDLVTDVLDASRIEAGGYRLALAPVAATEVVEEACRILAPLAAERGVRLQRAIGPQLPSIQADRRALKQILVNVVSNALKYTPSGGLVAVRAVAEAGGISIVIADSGTGIAPEDVPRVTEPFFRACDAYMSGTSGGAGLGLAIANGLVEAHGGSLAIASKVGEGTTVTLRFPPSPPTP